MDELNEEELKGIEGGAASPGLMSAKLLKPGYIHVYNSGAGKYYIGPAPAGYRGVGQVRVPAECRLIGNYGANAQYIKSGINEFGIDKTNVYVILNHGIYNVCMEIVYYIGNCKKTYKVQFIKG